MPTPADRDELGEEIAQLKPNLLAFAHSLTHDRGEAEDLVQETFTRALGARHRFEIGTNLRAWLFTILRHLHLNRRRHQAAHPGVVSLDELALERATQRPVDDVERQALARADLARIGAAFRTLPAEFAAPLHLVAVEDLTYAQIAALLEIPVGTVMSRIHRARRLLLARIGEDGR